MNQEKETLTREIIKKETTKIAKNTIMSDIPLLVVGFVPLAATFWLWVDMCHWLDYLFFIFFALPIVLCVYIFIFDLSYCLNIIKPIKNDKFDIMVKKLVDTSNGEAMLREYVRNKAIYNTGFIPNRTLQLNFSEKLKYNVPAGISYSWSIKHAMIPSSVFRSSKVGDEFYIVVINNKVIMAYNTKFFELQQ